MDPLLIVVNVAAVLGCLLTIRKSSPNGTLGVSEIARWLEIFKSIYEIIKSLKLNWEDRGSLLRLGAVFGAAGIAFGFAPETTLTMVGAIGCFLLAVVCIMCTLYETTTVFPEATKKTVGISIKLFLEVELLILGFYAVRAVDALAEWLTPRMNNWEFIHIPITFLALAAFLGAHFVLWRRWQRR